MDYGDLGPMNRSSMDSRISSHDRQIADLLSHVRRLEGRSVSGSKPPNETQIGMLRMALMRAREKLRFYCSEHSGMYMGGMEFSSLMSYIDEALGCSDAEPS